MEMWKFGNGLRTHEKRISESIMRYIGYGTQELRWCFRLQTTSGQKNTQTDWQSRRANEHKTYRPLNTKTHEIIPLFVQILHVMIFAKSCADMRMKIYHAWSQNQIIWSVFFSPLKWIKQWLAQQYPSTNKEHGWKTKIHKFENILVEIWFERRTAFDRQTGRKNTDKHTDKQINIEKQRYTTTEDGRTETVIVIVV